MKPTSGVAEYDRLFEAEDWHFWFAHRNEVIGDVVRRLVAARPPGYRVLEVGCGNGNVLRELERVCAAGTVVGAELYPERLRLARERVRCELVTADLYRMSFPHPFDVVGLFDVLEHLEDDVRALAGLRDALHPGGAAVVTVPAHMALWSYADVAAEHHRRYTPQTLAAALRAAGFRVARLTQFMLPVAPLLWAARTWAGRKRRAGSAAGSEKDLLLREYDAMPAPVNAALRWLLRFERAVLRRGRGLPVGASLLAVAYRDPAPAVAA